MLSTEHGTCQPGKLTPKKGKAAGHRFKIPPHFTPTTLGNISAQTE